MFYKILRFTFKPLIKKLFDLKVEGLENIPRIGGCILALNHFDILDPAFIIAAEERRIYFFTRAEAFKSLWSMFWVRLTDQIPVEFGNSEKAIRRGIRHLKNGRIVGIFPEGTTIGAPKIRRFRRGVARLALEARVPIIPIALINTYKIFSTKYRFIRKIKPVKIRIGKPLYFKEYYGMQNDLDITQKVADEVKMEVIKLMRIGVTTVHLRKVLKTELEM